MMFNVFMIKHCLWSYLSLESITFLCVWLYRYWYTLEYGIIVRFFFVLTSGFLNWLNYQIVLHLIIFPYILHALCSCINGMSVQRLFICRNPSLSLFAWLLFLFICVLRFCWAYRITTVDFFFAFCLLSLSHIHIHHHILSISSVMNEVTFWCGQCVTNRSRLVWKSIWLYHLWKSKHKYTLGRACTHDGYVFTHNSCYERWEKNRHSIWTSLAKNK